MMWFWKCNFYERLFQTELYVFHTWCLLYLYYFQKSYETYSIEPLIKEKNEKKTKQIDYISFYIPYKQIVWMLWAYLALEITSEIFISLFRLIRFHSTLAIKENKKSRILFHSFHSRLIWNDEAAQEERRKIFFLLSGEGFDNKRGLWRSKNLNFLHSTHTTNADETKKNHTIMNERNFVLKYINFRIHLLYSQSSKHSLNHG